MTLVKAQQQRIARSRIENRLDWHVNEADGIKRQMPVPSSGREKPLDDDDEFIQVQWYRKFYVNYYNVPVFHEINFHYNCNHYH